VIPARNTKLRIAHKKWQTNAARQTRADARHLQTARNRSPKCGHFGAKMWKKNEAECSRQTALIVHLKKPLLALQIPRAHTEIVEKVTTAAAVAPVRPRGHLHSVSISIGVCFSMCFITQAGRRRSPTFCQRARLLLR